MARYTGGEPHEALRGPGLEEEPPFVILERAGGPPPVEELAEGGGQLGAGAGGAVRGEGLDETELLCGEGPAVESDRVGDPWQSPAPFEVGQREASTGGRLCPEKTACGYQKTIRRFAAPIFLRAVGHLREIGDRSQTGGRQAIGAQPIQVSRGRHFSAAAAQASRATHSAPARATYQSASPTGRGQPR